jgi:hypothetical protein
MITLMVRLQTEVFGIGISIEVAGGVIMHSLR